MSLLLRRRRPRLIRGAPIRATYHSPTRIAPRSTASTKGPEDDVAPTELPERDRPPLGAGQLELGRGLAPPERRNDAHSGDFRQGSQPLRDHEMGRRLATFPSIPYAALSRTRNDMAIRKEGCSPTDHKMSRSIRSGLIFLVPVLLAFAGCMVGPNYQRPKVSVSPNWGGTGDQRVSTESTIYRDWWRAFNDPVLDRLEIG